MNTTALIRPAWTPATIALMVIGFMVFWPLGLAMLAYIIWGDRLEGFKRDVNRGDRRLLRRRCRGDKAHRWGHAAAPATSLSTTGAKRNSSASTKSAASSTRCWRSSTPMPANCAAPRTRKSSTASWPTATGRPRRQGPRQAEAETCSTKSESATGSNGSETASLSEAAPFLCAIDCVATMQLPINLAFVAFPRFPAESSIFVHALRPFRPQRRHARPGRGARARRRRPRLPLRIVENERARRLTLRIDAGGRGLRITVPPGSRAARSSTSSSAIRAGWSSGWPRCRTGRRCGPGIKIPLRGVPHLIVHEPATRGTVTVQHGRRRARCLDRPWRPAAPAAPHRRFSEARGQARDRDAGGQALRGASASAPRRSASRTPRAAGVPAPRTATCPSPGAS